MTIDNCSFDIPLEVKDEGFYRRPLPPELTEFSSEQGRTIFREALLEGNMAQASVIQKIHSIGLYLLSIDNNMLRYP